MTEPTPRVLAEARILGTWQLLRAEASLGLEPGTRMHFGANRQLEYTIPAAEGALRVVLVWRLEGALLHTCLDDGSNPVEVHVSIDDAALLTFNFGGPTASFVRVR